MSEKIDLSIVIVNWNARELLAQCLRSIEDDIQTCQRLNVEMFVVDNASTDGSAATVCEQFPKVCLIANDENLGFACANNQAIRQSRGRYVLLLNSDTRVCPGALEALLRFMDAHPRAGAAGACLLNADGSLQPSCHPLPTPGREFWRLVFLEPLVSRATYPMHRWDSSPRQVEVIKGACLLLRRAALEQVGLLDEAYFMYTEEVDLCYRLALAAWELWWLPTARMTHYGEASTRQVAEAMYVQLYRSKVQFHRKFGGQGRARWFKTLLALAYIPRWLLTSVGQVVVTSWRPRARTYRRLLIELPGM